MPLKPQLDSNRRNFLKFGAGTAAGASFLPSSISKAFTEACGPTPAQTQGPFYPGESKFNEENDLTVIRGSATKAKGQVIYVKGKVVDLQCTPIEGANVEIWQACESGKYNNPRDPNPAPIDPNFRYWGETYTDQSGEYIFKTIIPGAYPAASDWKRPPHIHFKISRLGFHDLVTQMYFKGNPLNQQDLILRQLSPKERESVVVDFQISPAEFEPGSLLGYFDITLRSIR